MTSQDPGLTESLLQRLRDQAAREDLRLTLHAVQEMAEEEIRFADLLAAVGSAQLLEEYPEHRRGACCLLCGYTAAGRPLHIVCTTSQPLLIVITVYEPKSPKWLTPTERASRP